MYGPFSAQYPGNSMGAVVEMTTRMPQKFEASVKVQGAWQDYSLYGTGDTYRSQQVSAVLGSRTGDFSWWLSANHLDSQTQPISIVTVAWPAATSALGTPVTGAYADVNRLGAPIFVIGSGGLEHKQQDTFKAKLAYDFTPEWRAAYAIGQFQNDARSTVETYLRNPAGAPVYSGADLNIGGYRFTGANAIGAAAFSGASGQYNIAQEHTAQSLSLRSNMQREWDWEASVSNTRFGLDTVRFPTTALPAAEGGGAGTIQSLNGTGWTTADLKGFWRPQGPGGAHQVSFGLHNDEYKLVNNTYSTTDWIGGAPGATTAQSLGRTRTNAFWAQDAWRFAPRFKLTLGGRQEYWRAFDGLNFSAAPASNVNQPAITSSKFSPKASLAWEMSRDWTMTGSYGTAYRFPTVTELYQATTVSGVVVTPNPNLRPEHAQSGELAIERVAEKSRLRVSLFQENLQDALIAQNSTIPGDVLGRVASTTQNIDKIRSRGIELVGERKDALIRGLDLFGSLTWVDSNIVSDPGFRNAAGVLTDVTGKYTPNIPRLKATAVAAYRYDDQWSGALAARSGSRVWSTVDNTDVYTHTYQGFDSYFVVDARLNYRFDRQTRLSMGIDNLNNRKYFLFHPFPQRTAFAELKYDF